MCADWCAREDDARDLDRVVRRQRQMCSRDRETPPRSQPRLAPARGPRLTHRLRAVREIISRNSPLAEQLADLLNLADSSR